MEGQVGDGRGGVAAVWVVQFDKSIEALLGVSLTLAAPQDLIWRRLGVWLDG